MIYENLVKMDKAELVEIAHKHGVVFDGRIGNEKLAALIIQSLDDVRHKQADKHREMVHPAMAKEAPEVVINTEEQVREVCKKYFDKEGFEAKFENDMWHFRYRGAEDCGHMSVPLRIIRMKAENVSRGARKIRMVAVSAVDGKPVMSV